MFLVIVIAILLLFMVGLYFLFRKFKMKTSNNILATLITGLLVGGIGLGAGTSLLGTHFVVVKEDLSTETLYSFGAGEYERANGKKVKIEKANNVLINDTGLELSFEEVVYGYGSEPTFDIIDVDEVYKISCLPASIYFFDDEPPAEIEIKQNETVTKYWVNVYSDEF